MKLVSERLSAGEIEEIIKEFGEYVKVTVDIGSGWVVIGPELPTTAGRHVDAVPMLKEKGGLEADIWGGWINFLNKEIEMSAVWNIRPQLNNSSMEILDPERRGKFEKIVKEIFEYLWI